MKITDLYFQMPLNPIQIKIMQSVREHRVLNAMQFCRLINGKIFGYCTRTAMGKDQTAKLNQCKLVEHCAKACDPTYFKVKTKLDQLVRKGLLMMIKCRFLDGNISGKKTDVFTFYFEDLDHFRQFYHKTKDEHYGGERV